MVKTIVKSAILRLKIKLQEEKLEKMKKSYNHELERDLDSGVENIRNNSTNNIDSTNKKVEKLAKVLVCIGCIVIAMMVLPTIITTDSEDDNDLLPDNNLLDEDDDTIVSNIVYTKTIIGEGKYVETILFLSNDVLINKSYRISWDYENGDNNNISIIPDDDWCDISSIEFGDSYIKFTVLDPGENPTVWFDVDSLIVIPTNDIITIEVTKI